MSSWSLATGRLHIVKVLGWMPQATRVSNTENVNADPSMSILLPDWPDRNPCRRYVPDIKALDRGLSDIDHPQAVSIS